MPISINNSLPSISILLGLTMEAVNGMRMLVETGTAMNSEYLDYHLWVMSQCPEIVAECLQCEPNTDNDVVPLLAALDLEPSHLPSTHGQITAVIRYHTPYLVNNKDPLILSFALGTYIALRSVLGLPTLLSMVPQLKYYVALFPILNSILTFL